MTNHITASPAYTSRIIATDVHVPKQIIRHVHFGLYLSPLHVRAWPLIENNFLAYHSLDHYYFLVVVVAIDGLGVQPAFF